MHGLPGITDAMVRNRVTELNKQLESFDIQIQHWAKNYEVTKEYIELRNRMFTGENLDRTETEKRLEELHEYEEVKLILKHFLRILEIVTTIEVLKDCYPHLWNPPPGQEGERLEDYKLAFAGGI